MPNSGLLPPPPCACECWRGSMWGAQGQQQKSAPKEMLASSKTELRKRHGREPGRCTPALSTQDGTPWLGTHTAACTGQSRGKHRESPLPEQTSFFPTASLLQDLLLGSWTPCGCDPILFSSRCSCPPRTWKQPTQQALPHFETPAASMLQTTPKTHRAREGLS